MENKRIYNVQNHFLVEIDDVKPFGSQGTISTTFTWDIYIASKGEEYKGKAIESNKNLVIPWTTLHQENYRDEMIKLCESAMYKL